MRSFQLMAVSALLMAGCSSFNHTVINQPDHPMGPPERTQKELARDTLEKIPLCPETDFDALPPVPAMPLGALKAVKPGDQDALDDIMLGQIRKLNVYAESLKHKVEKAHADYHQRCAEYRETKKGLE